MKRDIISMARCLRIHFKNREDACVPHSIRYIPNLMCTNLSRLRRMLPYLHPHSQRWPGSTSLVHLQIVRSWTACSPRSSAGPVEEGEPQREHPGSCCLPPCQLGCWLCFHQLYGSCCSPECHLLSEISHGPCPVLGCKAGSAGLLHPPCQEAFAAHCP